MDPSLTRVKLISPIIQETSAGDFLGQIKMKKIPKGQFFFFFFVANFCTMVTKYIHISISFFLLVRFFQKEINKLKFCKRSDFGGF